MKTKLSTLSLQFVGLIFLLSSVGKLSAQGTAFTYQGLLKDGATPANGIYDLRFAIYDSFNSANTLIAGPLTNAATTVSSGLFVVTLDFGPGVFTGANRWLEIGVRSNSSGAFSILTVRQKLTATPYSITAGNLSGPLPAGQLTGTLPSAQLTGTYSAAVTFSNANNSFSGNGAGLTSLNASNLSSGTVPIGSLSNAWKITGNGGTTPGTHFLGTTDNRPLEFKVNGVRALRLEYNGDGSDSGLTPDGAPNVVAGSLANFVAAAVVGATIGGGGATNYDGFSYTNAILADYGAIAGGLGNRVSAGSFAGFIAGGSYNNIRDDAPYAAVGGGAGNDIGINSSGSVIGGGFSNEVGTNSGYGTIGGGGNNSISNSSPYGTIAGGVLNAIGNSAENATIGGGRENSVGLVSAYGSHSVVAGGYRNSVDASASAIIGGSENSIAGSSSVLGGGFNNTVNGGYAVLGGGQDNYIGTNSYGAILGGRGNYLQNLCDYGSIGGGRFNVIAGGCEYATIAGGSDNAILWNADYSSIGGGRYNTVIGNANDNIIAGGASNDIGTNVSYCAIGGGFNNGIHAELQYAVIGGGAGNDIGINASYGVIAGGSGNNIGVNATFATIAGGQSNNAAGPWSFAAGRRAKANHAGSFVWGDSTDADIVSTNNNSITIRASGGYRLFSGTNTTAPAPGAYLAPGSSSWTTTSDRSAKKDFAPVDGVAVLEKLALVPVQEWHYNWEESTTTPHIGPMAQDFKAAFYPGRDDTGISTLEFDGVALAAIQGLNHKLGETRIELKLREKENAELRRRLEKLERLMDGRSE